VFLEGHKVTVEDIVCAFVEIFRGDLFIFHVEA
jgi:hypothetical protein